MRSSLNIVFQIAKGTEKKSTNIDRYKGEKTSLPSNRLVIAKSSCKEDAEVLLMTLLGITDV